jgi:hypothetical protein
MRNFILNTVIFLIGLNLYAQSISEADTKQASELKTRYAKDPVVALQLTTAYYFELPKAAQNLTVRQQDYAEFMALLSNTPFIVRSYFNNNSTIESYSLRQGNGKLLSHDKFCGHYSQDDVFYSDAQVCAYRFTLSVPGQIARYESTKLYKDPRYLTKAFFHHEAPVEKRLISIHVPNWANVELLEMNFDGYDITRNITSSNGITIYTYQANNIGGFPKEKDTPGYLHFLPHILILTKEYQINGITKTVLSSTNDLYAWYSSLVSKLKPDTKELKPLVEKLTADLQTDEEKIKAIYYWVQDNIKYIAFEDGLAGFKPEEAHEVYYKRYGDCKGMANLAKEMLSLAGFDARLTWVGTDRIPYSYSIPSLAVDNHMICTVFNQDKLYILDPTESFSPLGAMAERIQGKQILIENGNTFLIKDLPHAEVDQFTQESHWEYSISGNSMTSKGKAAFNGESKKIILNVLHMIKAEERSRYFKTLLAGTGNPDFLSIYDHSAMDREAPFQISFSAMSRNQYNKFNNEVYIDLDFSDDLKNLSLDKNRKVPYKFPHKVYQKTVAELVIPDKHRLKHLPDPINIKSELFEFDMSYEVKDDKLIYSKVIKIRHQVLPVAQFEAWNKAINDIRKFYDDQIILIAHD